MFISDALLKLSQDRKYKTYGDLQRINANREKYPEIAVWVDIIRKHFPGAKVKGLSKKGYFRVKTNENTEENKSDCKDNATIEKTETDHTP